VYQIYDEYKFVLLDIDINYENEETNIMLPEVINPNEFSIKAIRKTMKYYIKEKIYRFIIGIVLILLYAALFPYITSNL